jgi:hypothetical protein
METAKEKGMIDLTKKPSVYQVNGYNNRQHYLTSLASEYGISKMEVFEIASLLGVSEDFDGLINSLDDYVLMRGE